LFGSLSAHQLRTLNLSVISIRYAALTPPSIIPYPGFKTYWICSFNLLSGGECNQREKDREFVREMLKEKNALKGEMDKRIVYDGEDFVKATKKTF
jgi:hypothetical protein